MRILRCKDHIITRAQQHCAGEHGFFIECNIICRIVRRFFYQSLAPDHTDQLHTLDQILHIEELLVRFKIEHCRRHGRVVLHARPNAVVQLDPPLGQTGKIGSVEKCKSGVEFLICIVILVRFFNCSE